MANLSGTASDVKLPLPSKDSRRLGRLIAELTRRDLAARFTGSALGLAWSILQPLSLVLLYWFVFTRMIPRAPAAGGESDYVLFLITGLLPWLGVSEGLMRSSTSIVENGPILRRLAMESEVLPVVPNVSAILLEAVALLLFTLFIIARGTFSPYLWLLPVAVFLQLILQIGLGWLLASLNVFFRDVVQVLGFVLSIWFYLSPILYDVAGPYERLFMWNPMTPLLGLFRSAILGRPLPGGLSIVFLLSFTIGIAALGRFAFRKLQPTLADLI